MRHFRLLGRTGAIASELHRDVQAADHRGCLLDIHAADKHDCEIHIRNAATVIPVEDANAEVQPIRPGCGLLTIVWRSKTRARCRLTDTTTDQTAP
jgi:hypothetical protein